jgi:hypothetical protein
VAGEVAAAGEDGAGAGLEDAAQFTQGRVAVRAEGQCVHDDGAVRALVGEAGLREGADLEAEPACVVGGRVSDSGSGGEELGDPFGGELDGLRRDVHADEPRREGAGEPEACAAASAAEIDQEVVRAQAQPFDHLAEHGPRATAGGIHLERIIVAEGLGVEAARQAATCCGGVEGVDEFEVHGRVLPECQSARRCRTEAR